MSSPATKHSSSTDDDTHRVFKAHIALAKRLTGEGKIRQALKAYKDAYVTYPSDKLKSRIHKVEKYLTEVGEDSDEADEDEADDMVHVGNGFYLFKELFNKLYTHQREGVLWMWNLYRKKKGGILGDDMGLGKTIQVIAFLSGLFDAEKVHAVLIILPVAVIVNWEREFDKWAPGITVLSFHGGTKRERERALSKIHRRGGVALTSYGMLVNNAPQLAEKDGREFVWDYVILDEGHKIKNPSTKAAKGVHRIPAHNRLILTGTPIMNNLVEMWALFDYCHKGALLGNLRTFKMEFESPINRASEKDATPGEQRLGQEIASTLTKLITPYFMRRSKAELSSKQKKGGEGGDNGDGRVTDMPALTRKNDLVIWVYLSEVQQKIYDDFSNSDDVKELLNTSRSPLVALTILKKICDHPRLLSTMQCKKLGLFVDHDDDVDDDDRAPRESDKQAAALRLANVSDEMLEEESGKLVFLLALLDNLKAAGHRCLVFSQSRKMLDIIERILKNRGVRSARLDGQVSKLQEREDIISNFNKNSKLSVFLLTTGVGGVGLTLTAADRVVIFDPSWNPATDAQAVDRAFRIGQDKNVVIYRLITCGSVEEKIYRRQIFKDSLMRLTTGDTKNPYKYFSRQELKELFLLDNPRVSTTQQQLQQLHEAQRKSDTALDEHIAFLYSLDMFGVSDHDLMFSKEAVAVEEEEGEGQQHDVGYIETRVNNAQMLLATENEENQAMVQQKGGYLTSQVFRDEAAAAMAASLPPKQARQVPDLAQGMQQIHINETDNDAQAEAYINRREDDTDDDDDRDTQRNRQADQSNETEEEEFVEALEDIPARDKSIKGDTAAGGDDSVLVLDDLEATAEVDDDLAGMEENERKTLLEVMRLSKQTAQAEEVRRTSWEDEEAAAAEMNEEPASEGHSNTDPDATQIEKYCATPQGKCMKEDKEGTPARTPRTPRTPNVTSPSRTPKRSTPGVVSLTPQEREERDRERREGKNTPQPRSTPVAGVSITTRPSQTQQTPRGIQGVETLTPAAASQESQGIQDDGSFSQFQVLPSPAVHRMRDTARSGKKNKRRSVCVSRASGIGLLGAHGDRAMTPREKSPEVVKEQLLISPSAARTPRSRFLDEEDEEDSPIVQTKRARKQVIASDTEDEEEEEEPQDQEEGDENTVEMSGDEAESDLSAGERTGRSVRTFLMDDDEDEEDDADGKEEEEAAKDSFIQDDGSDDGEEAEESHVQEEGEEDEEEEVEEDESDEEESEEEEELTEEDIEQYNSYMSKSKVHKAKGEIMDALKCALKALKICNVDEKAQIYVLKLKQKLEQQQGEEGR